MLDPVGWAHLGSNQGAPWATRNDSTLLQGVFPGLSRSTASSLRPLRATGNYFSDAQEMHNATGRCAAQTSAPDPESGRQRWPNGALELQLPIDPEQTPNPAKEESPEAFVLLPDPTWATGDEPIGHGDEVSGRDRRFTPLITGSILRPRCLSWQRMWEAPCATEGAPCPKAARGFMRR